MHVVVTGFIVKINILSGRTDVLLDTFSHLSDFLDFTHACLAFLFNLFLTDLFLLITELEFLLASLLLLTETLFS